MTENTGDQYISLSVHCLLGEIDNVYKGTGSCHDMPSLSDGIESDSPNFDHTSRRFPLDPGADEGRKMQWTKSTTTYTKTNDLVCNHTD